MWPELQGGGDGLLVEHGLQVGFAEAGVLGAAGIEDVALLLVNRGERDVGPLAVGADCADWMLGGVPVPGAPVTGVGRTYRSPSSATIQIGTNARRCPVAAACADLDLVHGAEAGQRVARARRRESNWSS